MWGTSPVYYYATRYSRRLRVEEELKQARAGHMNGCTGYLAHPLVKSRCKKDRVCLHWLQMDVQRGYKMRVGMRPMEEIE